jgi:polysaccharide deacetylase 2 family uncharacterized protein YibQ
LTVALLLVASLVVLEISSDHPGPRWISRITNPKPDRAPRLALIIDDGGYNIDNLRGILRLGVPMTFAILPNTPHTREAASLVHQNGGEVMLHLPMEPKDESRYALEKDMVKSEMSSPVIQRILRDGLRQIPHVRGVNPHMGSKATEDLRVMEALMDVLKDEGLYYIDSHTTPSSQGLKTARRRGIPSAQNDKFIDAVKKPELLREAIRAAIIQAKREGAAVAIGHLDPLTSKAIQEMIPEIEKAGIRFVFASEVVG